MKGIIFDMDGTLWDSAENVAKSWDEAVKAAGYPDKKITTGDIKGVMGKTMDVIAELLFREFDPDTRKELLERCCAYENEYLRAHGGVLYKNLRGTMEQLKAMGYGLYIVSNCQKGYIEAFLDYYKFHDLILDTECYGNNLKQKGDNIALLALRNDLEEAVYVGDIQGDYDATMAASDLFFKERGKKISFIHAAYGFGTVKEKTVRISQFSELPQIIESVLPR